MTFSLPEELAERLVHRVPARDRSQFLAKCLEKSLLDDERRIVRACLAANEDAGVREIEQEWDQLNDPSVDAIREPWDYAEADVK